MKCFIKTQKIEKYLALMSSIQKLSNGIVKRLPEHINGTFYEKYVLK